jgi:hypothetical protein
MAAGALAHHRTFGQIFGVPIVLAILTAAGLLSALLGDGVWNALSWLALGILLVVIAWYAGRPARPAVAASGLAASESPRAASRKRRAMSRRKGARS